MLFCPRKQSQNMIIKIATCLLAAGLFSSCASTQVTKQGTLEDRMKQQHASNYAVAEPAPPAEGPEDVPAESPSDVNRNPALVPSPLLRASAASGSP
jgi:hypothetical protein